MSRDDILLEDLKEKLKWLWEEVNDLDDLLECPVCHAVVVDMLSHKDWHLELRK
jgi:hypothetical protein